MSEPKIDFAIITAIAIEREAVCKAFRISDQDRVRKESRTYWRKQLQLKDGEFYEIVVAQSADMANVDAAILTNDLIHEWHPGVILLVGIAAGVDSQTQHLGDLVIGSHIYYYERGKMASDGKKLEPYIIEADATLLDRANHSATWKSSIPEPRPDHKNVRPIIHQGVIASGEKVIAEEGFRNELMDEQRKIAAIEMEGYGFSHAARQNFGQIRHLVMKAICDWADASKNQEWQPYAAAVVAGFTKHFLLDRPLDPCNPRLISHSPSNGEDSHLRVVINPIIEALKFGSLVPFLGQGVNPYFYMTLAAKFFEFVENKLQNEGDEGNSTNRRLIERLIGSPCAVCHYGPKDRPKGCPMQRGVERVADCPLYIEQELVVSKINLRYLSQYYIVNDLGNLYGNLYEISEKIDRQGAKSLYLLLAKLPGLMSSNGYPKCSPGLPYQLIVTTNYDDILEKTFSAMGQPFDVVFYVTEGNEKGMFKHQPYKKEVQTIETPKYDQLPLRHPWGHADQPRPIILKLFGTLETYSENNFIATEEQFSSLCDNLSDHLPTSLLRILRESHILFMGYSPSDTDLDRIVHCLWPEGKRLGRSWLLHQSEKSELGLRNWESRNVSLQNMPLRMDDFVAQLKIEIEAQIQPT